MALTKVTGGVVSPSSDYAINNVTGVAATFTGNVSIGGTLTYQDVSNIDAVGIITAQKGIQITGDGLNVTGISTFNNGVGIADSIFHIGDIGTFMKFNTDEIVFETGATSKVFINDEGDLTVGASEGNLGKIYIKQAADTDTEGLTLLNSGASNSFRLFLGDTSGAVAHFGHGGQKQFNITQAGKIGIGTTNPDSGQLQVIGNGYHQINISANKNANANKLSGISFLNYEGDKTSVFQTYASNSSNSIYYGSADNTSRGVQYHNFYVNTSRTATTNHALALRIDSSGHITPGTDNSQNIGDGSKNFASIWASTRFRGNDNVKLVLGNSQNLVIRHDGSNNIIGSPVADDLHIKSGTGDNDNQLIASFKHSDGSVGIGTTNVNTSNGAVGRKFGIFSSQNNVLVSETTSSSHGLLIEGRRTGRDTNKPRYAQIGLQQDGSGDGMIKFSTAPDSSDSVEALRIHSDGSITQNYGNPNDSSVFRISKGGNGAAELRFDTATNNTASLYLGSDEQLRIRYGGTETVRFTSSGNVGINDDNPGAQLVVKATTDDNPALQLYRQSTGGDIASINWQTGSGTQAKINYRGAAGASEGLQFYTAGGSSSHQRMIIDHSGRVGIGTDDPGEKLDVEGSLRLRAGGNWTTYATRLTSRLDSTHMMSLEAYHNSSTAVEVLGTYADSGGSNMRTVIAADGMKVGIGTDKPTAILSFNAQRATQTYPPICFQTSYGAGLADAAISTTDDSGGTDIMMGSNVYMGQNGAFNRYYSSYGSAAVRCQYTGKTIFYNKSGNNAPAESMRIDGDGDVGIGEDNPGSNSERLIVRKDVAAASGKATLGIHNLYQGTSGQSNASTGELNFIFKNHNASHNWWGGRIACFNTDNYNQYTYLRFDTASAGNAAEKMRLTHNGAVVIRHNGATASDAHAGLEVRSTKDKFNLLVSSKDTAAADNKVKIGFKLHPSGQNERIKAGILVEGNGGAYGEPDFMDFCLDGVADNGSVATSSDDSILTIFNKKQETYGASNFAITGSGDRSNTSQAHPKGTIQWQSNTGNGNNKFLSYIQTTGANEGDMYITIRNGSMYRITVKKSHDSTSAVFAMYLVYGLNGGSSSYPIKITEVVNDSGFTATRHNYKVNSYDQTLKISHSGACNQGLRALVEIIGGF